MIEANIFAAEVLKQLVNWQRRSAVGIPIGTVIAAGHGAFKPWESRGIIVRMTDPDHDMELVALIDNELEGDTRARLLARLAEDEAIRKRYDALREAGRLMVMALDALLQEAPLPQLRACLPPEVPRRAPSARFAGIVLRGLAAGIAFVSWPQAQGHGSR
jgi:hypothetical protein